MNRDSEVLHLLKDSVTEVNAQSRALKLIKDGSRVRLVDPETQTTALMYAARGLMTPVVKAILDRLKNPAFQSEEANKVNAKGQRALDLVVSLPPKIQTRAQYESMVLKAGIDAEIQVQKEFQDILANRKVKTRDPAIVNTFEGPSNPLLTRRGLKRGGRKTRRGGESDRAAIIKLLQPITEKTPGAPSGLGTDAAFEPKELRQEPHTNRAIKANIDKTLTKFDTVPDPEVKEMKALTTPAPLSPEKQQAVAELKALDSAPPDIPDQPVGTPWKVTDPVTGKTSTGKVTAGRKTRKNKARKSTFRRHRK